MSDRPTPETDAAYKYWPSENAELVDADFARNLERERDEAREALGDWENAAAHVEADHPDERHCGCVPVLRKLLTDSQKERDEWAAMCGRYKQERDIAEQDATNYHVRTIELINERDKTRQERDEAREALKKCREDSVCYAEHMRKCGYSKAYKESKENADRATRILKETK